MNMYRKAILSQSACNVSGLVHELANLMDEIWKEAREKNEGTDWVNSHPVVVLFAHQIHYLSQRRYEYHSDKGYSEAYSICRMSSDEKGEG